MNFHSIYPRVLVTGGSGLVGSAIQNLEKNYYFHFIYLSSQDVDLRSYEQTLSCFQKHNVEFVIHLAAKVGGLYHNMRNQVEMLEDNLLINQNVLKACHYLGVRKVVCCLSTCIFPDGIEYPIDESKLHLGPPHHSNFGYSYAKRMLEVQCRAYQENYGRDYICVIPTNIYGENDNFSLEQGHVIPALVHKCYLSQKKKIPWEIKGSGKAQRQFIYAGDLARLLIWCLEGYRDREPLILSGGQETEISIRHVVEKIKESFEFEGKIKWNTNEDDGQILKTADNSKLVKLIPQFQFTPFSEGIEKTVKWFRDNYPKCRL